MRLPFAPSSPLSVGAGMDVERLGFGTWAWGNKLLWGYDPDADAELQRAFDSAWGPLDSRRFFFDTRTCAAAASSSSVGSGAASSADFASVAGSRSAGAGACVVASSPRNLPSSVQPFSVPPPPSSSLMPPKSGQNSDMPSCRPCLESLTA